ncbi:MAG: EamA family transporter [Oscillospiraceae bacterium]|nr:EamA family transporter [Oscillospiraceae bacterium]
MEVVLLLGILTVLHSFQTLFCTLYTSRYPGKEGLASPVFCVLQSVVIALFTWVCSGFATEAAPLTVVFGVLNAMMLFGFNTSLMKAGAMGSYAFMNMMLLFGGILVPVIYAALFVEGESLSTQQLLAIGLMLVAFVLMNVKEIRLKGTKPIYYVYCVLLFLCNGFYGTLLKMQSVHYEEQKDAMVVISYALMGVIALVQLCLKERKDTLRAFKLNRKAALPLLCSLVSSALAINVLTRVIPLADTATLFTVDNGGVLVLAAAYSFLIFKEKPELNKILAMVLAIGSIIVFSL